MYAVFCSDPLNPRKVEPDYLHEAECAHSAGFKVVVLDHDELDHRIAVKAALKHTKIEEPSSLIYRGWMLRSEAYEQLCGALEKKQIKPFVSAKEYEACHHAPNTFDLLKPFIPKTTFVDQVELDSVSKIHDALKVFSNNGVVIKDWVKSQASGYWEEACYIPDASNLTHAEKVINRFRELQANSLVGGIVFKQYVPLKPVGSPAYEYRAFVVQNKVIGCWPRSAEAADIESPPDELLQKIASSIPSPFASIDLSIDENGNWWLLETGDGQVSGLPTPDAAPIVFDALAKSM